MFKVQSSKFKVPLDPKGRFHSEAEKECSKFKVQKSDEIQRVRAFKMQKYIFRKRKHHFLCYFLLNNPQKPKVPLDPKGRFHSEAEKECSKFIV